MVEPDILEMMATGEVAGDEENKNADGSQSAAAEGKTGSDAAESSLASEGEGAASDESLDLVTLDDDAGDTAAEGDSEQQEQGGVNLEEAYRPIAEALGIEDAKKDNLLDAVVQLKDEKDALRAELDSKEAVFANDDIKAMNEIAKAGGDFMGYQTSKAKIDTYKSLKEDLKKQNDADLFAAHLKYRGKSAEEIENHLDKLEDYEIKDKAEELRTKALSDLDAAIAAEQNQMETARIKAEESKRKFRQDLSSATAELKDVAGVAIKLHQKDAVKRALLSHGVDKYFPVNENGERDAKTWMMNAAKIELFDKLVAKVKSMATSKERTNNFNQLHNIEQPNEKTTASDHGDGAGASALETFLKEV